MITGGCRCGAIRYRVQAQPVVARLCWCRDCQYWASGNASANIIVPRDALQVDGTPSHYDSLADSGHPLRRSFCRTCGTPLFSEDRTLEAFIVVRVGTLDYPARFRPECTIWTASAPPWAVVDATLPVFTKQPG